MISEKSLASNPDEYGFQSLRSSAATVALDAIKAIRVSVSASLEELDHPIPAEILTSSVQHLNLKRWSLLLKDRDLKELDYSNENGQFYNPIDSSKDSVKDMFSEYSTFLPRNQNLLLVNISGALHVTDFGLTSLVRRHPAIQHLDISGCKSITDVGIREVGLNCRCLEYLNLSSTFVAGSALVAIAEGCPSLSDVNLSKCQRLQKYGITKIFYSCKKLSRINLSFLKEIGDTELRVLALNSPFLRVVKVRECSGVSDQGIIAIAEYCPELEYLDLRRSQLQFKISDASLSVLGERSKSLLVFLANGCEHITDVGVTWLSLGCKHLERVELEACVKVASTYPLTQNNSRIGYRCGSSEFGAMSLAKPRQYMQTQTSIGYRHYESSRWVPQAQSFTM